MKITRPDLAALALVALIVVAIVVLKLQRVDVPQILEWLAVSGLGGALGLGPGGSPSTSTTSDPLPAAPAAGRDVVPLGPAVHS